ncbi:MAG: hypothetical protein SRB1_00762 [Desulfobacteraceae bacterium Eth-SRB1]|nr:MAG: hypothetical protein SRB1_00762 [Desulfobacteraceae bacterium Eth-SRB1]
MPFSPNSALCEKNYPRNINYMPAVIFFASLDFGKNCYSRTASEDCKKVRTPPGAERCYLWMDTNRQFFDT